MKSFVSLLTLLIGLVFAGMSISESDMDNRIASSVMATYVFKAYLQDEHITIVSTNGVVTLSGTIADEFKKALAQETVDNLPDVKGVDNRLEVKGPTLPILSDVWIHDKLKITLMFHRSVNVFNTGIEVKDGRVTLQGVADSQAQKELTMEYSKDINGVKDVKNIMTVTGPKKTNSVVEDIDDASITAQVKLALLFHHSTCAIITSVVTNKGEVTLYGKARSKTKLDLATKFAMDIKGVKAVNNWMFIESHGYTTESSSIKERRMNLC